MGTPFKPRFRETEIGGCVEAELAAVHPDSVVHPLLPRVLESFARRVARIARKGIGQKKKKRRWLTSRS